jgi:hypothetical protein
VPFIRPFPGALEEFCWVEGIVRGGRLAACPEHALDRYPEHEPSESLALLLQLGVFAGLSNVGVWP